MVCLPEREDVLAARKTCRGPIDVGAGGAGEAPGATDDDVAAVRAEPLDRAVVELERLVHERAGGGFDERRAQGALGAAVLVDEGSVEERPRADLLRVEVRREERQRVRGMLGRRRRSHTGDRAEAAGAERDAEQAAEG